MPTPAPDDGLMTRRYTFKLYPNAAQAEALETQRRLHSALYNALIQQRIEAYQRGQWTLAPTPDGAPRTKRGKTLTAFDQGKELTAVRAEFPEYRALSRGAMEQTAKRVDLAFQAFFRRAKEGAGASAGFPRFKRCEGFGFREMGHGGWRFDGKRLVMQGAPGAIRARGEFPGDVRETRTCELMWREGRWWLSVVVKLAPRMATVAALAARVRFDLLDRFAQVSWADGGQPAGPEETVYAAADGRISLVTQEATPRPSESPSERGGTLGTQRCSAWNSGSESPSETPGDGVEALIQSLQRRMAGCKRGSCRYRRLRAQKAKIEAKIARRRREAGHLWTTGIARRAAEAEIISPPVKDVTKSGRGTEKNWGAAVETKAEINRRILGQSPAATAAMLAYKIAERGGVTHATVDTAPTVAVGSDLVAATKAMRRAARTVKKAT